MARSPAKRRPTTSARAEADRQHWLRKIFNALSLSNLIAIAAVSIAVPSAIIAWHQLVEEPQRMKDEKLARQSNERAVRAAELQARIAAERERREAGSKPQPLPLASQPVIQPVQTPHVVVAQSSTPDHQVELTRPYIYLKSASLLEVKAGEKVVFDVIIANRGRPTQVSSTSSIGLIQGNVIPYIVPSCKDTITYGSSHTLVDVQHSQPSSQKPILINELELWKKGLPLVLSETFCYSDPISKKRYVTHVCLIGQPDGTTRACRRGNDAS